MFSFESETLKIINCHRLNPLLLKKTSYDELSCIRSFLTLLENTNKIARYVLKLYIYPKILDNEFFIFAPVKLRRTLLKCVQHMFEAYPRAWRSMQI